MYQALQIRKTEGISVLGERTVYRVITAEKPLENVLWT